MTMPRELRQGLMAVLKESEGLHVQPQHKREIVRSITSVGTPVSRSSGLNPAHSSANLRSATPAQQPNCTEIQRQTPGSTSQLSPHPFTTTRATATQPSPPPAYSHHVLKHSYTTGRAGFGSDVEGSDRSSRARGGVTAGDADV